MKVLWLIELVKSGFWSFMLEISHWMMLHGQVDQWNWDINWEQSYATREIANILKISKSGVENHLHQLGYVNCFDVWVPPKWSETFLTMTIFPCAILYWNVTKTFHFQDKLWWVMKSGYCTTRWNGRDRGASEMNHHQPHQRTVFIQRRWCCVYGGIGRESSIASSFWKAKR